MKILSALLLTALLQGCAGRNNYNIPSEVTEEDVFWLMEEISRDMEALVKDAERLKMARRVKKGVR